MLDKGNKQNYVQGTQPRNKKSRKSAARNWKKGTDLESILKIWEASAVPEEWREMMKSPNDAFKTMSSDDLVLQVTNQTNLCAVKHGKGAFWRMKLGILLQFCCCKGLQSSTSKSLLGRCT